MLERERSQIQDTLNFEKYIGEDLWLEFVSYRREDTYQNSNFISDGLNNAELFQNALEFVEIAKKEIYKSATLQNSISATLKNLLVMKEFAPIVDHFEIGNWLRIRVDGKINLLRLIGYEINFDDLDNLSVTFSDVKIVKDGLTDVQSVLNQASSMATSYDAVARQASKGNNGNSKLLDWVNKGLALTKMKIVDNADNQNITWDSHGLLCKEYLPITDTYDEKQLKIINRGLYLTDDNWQTSRAGIGNFAFYNPETEQFQESYGVIADTLVGNLVLSEKVGVYNTNNSIVMGEKGLIITTDSTGNTTDQVAFTIQNKTLDENGQTIITPTMYIDADGHLVLNGSVKINSSSGTSSPTLNDLMNPDHFSSIFETTAENVFMEFVNKEGGIQNTLDKYFVFSADGLVIGERNSNTKLNISNNKIAFVVNDSEKWYWDQDDFYVGNIKVEVSKRAQFGNFAFVPRSDGSLSFLKVGE